MFKIATWNVNSLRVREAHVVDWIKANSPDVLALQETKLLDDAFPAAVFEALGYRVIFSGQKTYNGVATLSRSPAEVLATELPGFPDPQKRVLAAVIDGVCVLNLYVPNGSAVGTDKYTYKLYWLSHLLTYTEHLLERYPRCLLLGDFNVAPADEDVHDPAEWRGKVLFSEPEKEAFHKLLDAGLHDCYRLFPQEPGGFTWWDYRAASFRRKRGLRIDHILASPALAAACQSCRIDVGPRKLEKPSDHAPVVAEFDLG